MKFRMTMKTPDCLDGVIEDAVGSFLFDFEGTPEQEEELRAFHTEEGYNLAKKFVEYNEYVSVEFDTETKTAIVVPVGE